MNIEKKKYELIKFEDGEFSLDVNVSPDEETVWISVQEMVYMFERDYKTIQKHINNVFFEKELDKTELPFVAKYANWGSEYDFTLQTRNYETVEDISK